MRHAGLRLSTTEVPGAGVAAPEGATAPPEQQTAGDAPPQGDEAEGADQPKGEGEDKLTPEQRTIRKLESRISRLTAKRGGTERENEILRQELDQARRQLQAASQQGEGSDESGETKPKGKALTEADIDRIANERATELQRQRSIGTRVTKVLEAGSKLEGFNAAVDAVAEVVPFTDRKGQPTPFIEAVLDADDPAAVLKHLGDNPDEAEELADLTPAQLGRRLAKLEDRLKQGAKKTSAAPKPLATVGNNNAGAEPDPSRMTDAQFNAWRRKQIEAKRGARA